VRQRPRYTVAAVLEEGADAAAQLTNTATTGELLALSEQVRGGVE
jgi:hypothetical protein